MMLLKVALMVAAVLGLIFVLVEIYGYCIAVESQDGYHDGQ